MDSLSKKVENVTMGEEAGMLPIPSGFITKCIHAGYSPEQCSVKAVVAPIVMSSTFHQHGTGEPVEFEYGRTGNPNRNNLEKTLASLEGAKYAATYPSGLAAVTAIVSLLKAGDHFISGEDIYGGTSRTFRDFTTNFGIIPHFVDANDLKAIEAAITPKIKMIWVELPTNPCLHVCDIRGLGEISKRHNLILAVDNSFLTPYCHRPLDFGADVVMYSLTKYYNGHSDIIMGAAVTNDENLYKKLRTAQHAGGIIPSPFDCSQVSRSVKTLALRMKQHDKNSYEIAKFLMSHPKVSKVLHPGLPNHPHHEIFKKQCSGYCGMVSFYHKGGFDESMKFLHSLKMFCVAGSLGGMNSLAELPLTLSHIMVPKETLKKLNITDNLIRLSLGIEDPEDIIADLKQALDKI